MKKRIFHNWGLKLASLVLAFALWFFAAKIGDPTDTAYFSNIPVRLTNTELLDRENKVYEVLDNTDTVRVTVRAPKSIISQLRSSDILAEADMSRLTDINTVAISYTVQNSNISIESVRGDHDVVRLNVEEKASKWIRVQYQTTGEVADGYMVADVAADQNRIEVSGPKSAVEKISYAGVEVDVNGASTDISLNVEPQLYDVDGKPLELNSVSKNVSYIHMSVDVLATKEVPIELNTMGVPDEGYLVTGVTECTPPTVKIAGSSNLLAGIMKIVIPEEELDITGSDTDFTKVINLKEYLPDGIRLADKGFNGRVKVIVYIEPEVEKNIEISAEKIDIVNVPEGYEVEIVEDETPQALIVSGLTADVTALSRDAVRGTVDVGAWLEEQEIEKPGAHSYTIPVSFTLPEDIKIKNEITIRLILAKTEEI